jgi:hypothetical protein
MNSLSFQSLGAITITGGLEEVEFEIHDPRIAGGGHFGPKDSRKNKLNTRPSIRRGGAEARSSGDNAEKHVASSPRHLRYTQA